MIVSHVRLKNWRNFREVDVALGNRVFLVGPNASGKSNFLEVFRFLQDIARYEGGLQKALNEHGGFSNIHCHAAKKDQCIEIEIHLSENGKQKSAWTYAVGIAQERRDGQSLLTFERVYRGKEEILSRPNKQDKKDPILLTQTHLEQVSANAPFRSILSFLSGISYRHIVPQLLRHPEEIRGAGALYGDPFGSSLLMNLYSRPKKKRDAMLKKIESALRLLVPQMKRLRYKNDTSQGINPHLEATFEHWRSDSEWQREIGFSDGTLRLIGLFWALLNEHSLLLLEEPELSLNASVIARLPSLFSQMNQKLLTQIIVSTHSFDLLQDKGIGGEEVLLFMPEQEGTSIKAASDETEIRALLESGLSVADAVLPLTSPPKLSSNRIGLFS